MCVFLDQEYAVSKKSLLDQCSNIQSIWKEVGNGGNSEVSTCLVEALKSCQSIMGECDVLITGSLHLVGAALAVLDPDRKTF